MVTAAECFKKAVALDPRYALAWSGLSDTLNSLAFYGLVNPKATLPLAKEAAQRAIGLDPLLAEAHMSLAVSHLHHDRDNSSAEREFLRSLELRPQNSLARSFYGLFYLQWAKGRFEEGREQAELAVQIDPLSAWFRGMLAVTYLPIDPGKCVETAIKTLQIDPNSVLGRWSQMTGLGATGRFAEAAEIGEMALRVFGRPVWFMASLARCYAKLGRRGDAEALYRELQWRAKREYVSPIFLALAACAAGEPDEAIRLAHEAHIIGDPTFLGLWCWPDHADLRGDPRFKEILANRG